MHIQNSGHPEFTWKSQGKKPVEFEVFVLVLMAKINGWFNLVRKGGFILIMLCVNFTSFFFFTFFFFFRPMVRNRIVVGYKSQKIGWLEEKEFVYNMETSQFDISL